jgi:hypothetical protein
MRVMTVTWVVKALVEATACSLPAFRYTPERKRGGKEEREMEGERGKEAEWVRGVVKAKA